MRLVIAVCLMLAFATGLAAAPRVSITPVDAPTPLKSYLGSESFEGVVPPVGWYLQTTNAAATWMLTTDAARDGVASAVCPVDPAGDPVSERLGFTYTYVSTESLHFYLMGEVGQDVTLEVWVGDDLILDFDRDWTLPADQWGLVELDLGTTGSVGLPDVDFAWHYVGSTAPAIYLDMVWIDEVPVGSDVRSFGEVKTTYR